MGRRHLNLYNMLVVMHLWHKHVSTVATVALESLVPQLHFTRRESSLDSIARISGTRQPKASFRGIRTLGLPLVETAEMSLASLSLGTLYITAS